MVPSAVLLASFLGSWHCVGMCGPLVMASTHSPLSVWNYHLGRLIGYLGVGALSALLGHVVLNQTAGLVATASTLLLGAFFMGVGAYKILYPTQELPTLGKVWITRYMGKWVQHKQAMAVGFASVFLPCGWLYTFVAAAMVSHSVSTSLIMMGLFWLGTLPALIASPLLLQKFLKPLSTRFPQFSGILLLLAGLAIILFKL